MIKINRIPKPAELTDEKVKKLTEIFKNEKKEVWNKPFIRDNLFKMSNGKCCYCEVKLGEEGKSMNVEHFHKKSTYPDEVVEWNNLLPSCAGCNSKKGTLDTYKKRIINPCEDNPKDYLYMQNYRYKSKSGNEIGRNTIKAFSLNDTKRLLGPRFKIGDKIQVKVNNIFDELSRLEPSNNIDVLDKNTFWETTRDLLALAQPTEEYSATVATVLVEDETYELVKNKLVEFEIWDDELEILDKCMREIALNR